MDSDSLTGQLIFRDASKKAPDGSGRRLMMFVGIIAVPQNFPFKGEHQYAVVSGDAVNFIVIHATETDLSEQTRGNSLGHLVLLPVWRV